MDESSGGSTPAGDAELLNRIRSGRPESYDVLRARHAAAAACLADRLGLDPDTATISVDTAFTLILDAIKRGGGPTDAFRPYLLTAIRRVAAGVGVPADDQQIPDPGQLFDGPPAAGGLGVPLAAAFTSLPERWRAVLWHADIERAAPADIGPVLGLAPAEVTALTANARSGLRHAYLQHQAGGGGRKPASLADTGPALRTVVAPMVLGTATAGYLVAIARLARSHRAAGSVQGLLARLSPAEVAGLGWLGGRPGGSPRRRRALAAAGALLAVFAVSGYVLFASSAGGVPAGRQRLAAAVPSPPGASVPADPPTPGSTAPTGTASASAASGHRHRRHKSRPHQAAPPPPAPAPSTPPPPHKAAPPAAHVTAEISVFGPGSHGNVAGVAFGITNGGPKSTGKLTAWITLPAGSKFVHGHHGAGASWGHGGWTGGWTCSADSHGAVCTHDALAASARSGSFLAAEVTSSSACGQPVSVTVTGGSAPASAQSSGTIQCGGPGHGPSEVAGCRHSGSPGGDPFSALCAENRARS